MTRVTQITKAVKRYDRGLYAKRVREPFGCISIYRKDNGGHSFVFSLTKNWTFKTDPVDWGIEPILARLKAMDLWTVETAFDRIAKDEEKIKEAKARNLHNNVESFLTEFRGQFAKTFSNVNTSLMNKIDRRKRKEKWQS